MPPLRQTGWHFGGVPVFMYHGLYAEGGEHSRGKYCLQEARFIAQLQSCLNNGMPVVSLKHQWQKADDANVVVYTFDDGLASDFEIAFPRLQERGCSADFFVNSSTIGKPGYVTWEQLKEMDKAGLSIQSHGSDHTPLTLLTAAVLQEQLRRGRREIEDHIGCVVEFLSVPFGFLNSRVMAAALEAGFVAVCDSVSLPARMGKQLIHRVSVQRGTSDREFKALLKGSAAPFVIRNVRSGLLHIPKQILLHLAPQALGLPTEVHP